MGKIIEVEIGFPKSIVQYEGEPTSKLVSTEKLQEELNLQLQQEQIYSEEDIMFAYEQGARLALISQSPLALHKGEFPTPKEWFEQFKKK